MSWILGLVAIAVSIYLCNLYFKRYLHERNEAARVRAMFSRYLPDLVVEKLLERKDSRLFEGREYYATVLSCGIWQFSLFAEDLTPQQTLRYLNEFYTLCGRSIEKHRGMIESLRGDGLTAVFGVLIDEPFQEERAIRAALDIVRLVSAMNARWQSQGRKPFQVGIGINSGNLIAGDVGFAQRREFALVGNDVQIASRLQEATEEMNASVIASAATFKPAEQLFVGIPIKTMPLRGLKKLQPAYIVRGLSKQTAEDRLTLPTEQAFRTTEITTEPAPARAEPAAVVAPEPPPPPVVATPAAPKPDYVFERGPQPVDPASPLPIPPTSPARERHFSTLDDDKPAMPDAPPTNQTYEDDSGPPLQLGP